jgi:hypothetical protein
MLSAGVGSPSPFPLTGFILSAGIHPEYFSESSKIKNN